mmetsp:Transcript_117290/g.331885  ORF Transcript_117290/g.331885 Transcript_117290/m.331885 type:complete len:245 (+) Transcript_117290:265-999(+)
MTICGEDCSASAVTAAPSDRNAANQNGESRPRSYMAPASTGPKNEPREPSAWRVPSVNPRLSSGDSAVVKVERHGFNSAPAHMQTTGTRKGMYRSLSRIIPKKHTNRSTPPKTTQLQAPRVATKRFVQKPWKMIMLRPATKKTLPISEPSNPYTSWQYMGNSPAKAPNDTICRSCARKTKPKLRSARMSLTICVSVPMPSAGFALPLCLVSKSGATVMVGALSGSEAEPITKFNNVKAAATKAT